MIIFFDIALDLVLANISSGASFRFSNNYIILVTGSFCGINHKGQVLKQKKLFTYKVSYLTFKHKLIKKIS